MPIQAPDPFGSFLQGRQARQQEDYGNTRNKLAQMELDNAPAQMQRQNALVDQQVQRGQQQLDKGKAEQAYAKLSQALESGNPKAYVIQNEPALVHHAQMAGNDITAMDDATATQFLQNMARTVAGAAGIMPAAPAGPMSPQGKVGADVRGGYLTQGQADNALNPGMTDYQRQSLAETSRHNRAGENKPAGQFRALTPEEVQKVGLPPGTSAQVGPDGKVDVLSKRDNTGVLSQKDAVTVRNKLTTIKVARKQLDDIKKSFTNIQGTMSAGAFGQGRIPSEGGQKFDAAVGRMRSTLTALTRVPGVGSMSDYETKLDQQKFPDRTNYESVTGEQIQGVDDLLTLLERGYDGLLSGGAQQSQEPAAQAAPRRVKVDAQGNVIGN